MKRIIERWYNFLGYEIHIRMEPKEFKRDVKRLGRLIEDWHEEDFYVQLAEARKRWGDLDPEFVRLETLAHFMFAEFDDEN